MALAKTAQAIREDYNFQRTQRAVGLRHSRRTDKCALLDVRHRRFHDGQGGILVLQTDGDIFPVLGVNDKFRPVKAHNGTTHAHGGTIRIS